MLQYPLRRRNEEGEPVTNTSHEGQLASSSSLLTLPPCLGAPFPPSLPLTLPTFPFHRWLPLLVAPFTLPPNTCLPLHILLLSW